MTWTVLFHDAFDAEFEALDEDLQDELLAHAFKESKNGKKTR